MPELKLDEVFGKGILERIPKGLLNRYSDEIGQVDRSHSTASR
jgi:hypothetical protein